MAKIKWKKVPDMLVWNRIKSLRKEEGLNQAQVAVGSGISIGTLYMIEQGYEEKTTEETKRKLAKFFKCDVEDIFPAQMVGNITKEEYEKEKKKMNEADARLITLKSFVLDLKLTIDEEIAYKEILSKASIDEIGDFLFHSGQTLHNVKIQMRRLSKKYNINLPKVRKEKQSK